jgi:2-(1,2-epoxy-1,2-dihydrophenyl)acetyl-CoA isomerase
MSYETISFAIEKGVARLVLNRPDRLNAFNVRMHGEVMDALSQVTAGSEVRVLLLTGTGRGFCAGQDLSERDVDAGPLDLGHTTGTYYNPLVRRLTALPLPVICAVNGVAAGAGVNIALACDIVLARKSAKFVQAFSSIGLVPDAGGTYSLPRLIGPARALGFTLTGATLSAETAQAWGLIWKAIEDEMFEPAVEELVQQMAEAPTLGLAAAKQAIRSAATATLDQQLELEMQLQRQCGLSEDYKEGVRAFKARRRPRFLGC